VLVVELLHLRLGDVLGFDPRLELLLHELLDHHLLHGADDLGVLVEAALPGLLGQDLEADQVVQELLLALERGVAGADVGRLLVDALLEVADRDLVTVDVRDDLA
jgi:hypothetical protein